jgi:hypothetical protein
LIFIVLNAPMQQSSSPGRGWLPMRKCYKKSCIATPPFKSGTRCGPLKLRKTPIMERHGVRSIVTFDADFDRWPGLKRVHGTIF